MDNLITLKKAAPFCKYNQGFKTELLWILNHFRCLIFCPPNRLVGRYFPGSRVSRYPSVLLLGWQEAGCLFGEACGGSGEGSGEKCCCSVGVCPLPDRSGPLSGSVGCDYATHYGNWHRFEYFLSRQVALHSSFRPSLILLTLFQQKRKLFPFLLLPAQALCYGDLEGDAWPVQYCASQGMELFCAQSFSHCFGLYGEELMPRVSPFSNFCIHYAYCKAKGTPQVKIRSYYKLKVFFSRIFKVKQQITKWNHS